MSAEKEMSGAVGVLEGAHLDRLHAKYMRARARGYHYCATETWQLGKLLEAFERARENGPDATEHPPSIAPHATAEGQGTPRDLGVAPTPASQERATPSPTLAEQLPARLSASPKLQDDTAHHVAGNHGIGVGETVGSLHPVAPSTTRGEQQ